MTRLPLAVPFVVPVRITGPAGIRSCELLVDTGAQLVTISLAAARDLGFEQLDAVQRGHLIGASGTIDVPIFTASEVAVGDVHITEVMLCVYDLPAELEMPIDGLLGMSFLERTNFTFNFTNRTFEIEVA